MKRILVLFFIFGSFFQVYATHNRAGEIVYEHLSSYTYKFTIITYTKESSVDADRDSLRINYGDGSSETIARVNEISLGNDVKYNSYIGIHTYSGPYIYIVSVEDPNLIDNIINIDFGSSVNTPFYLEDTIKILDPDYYGYNNSPILLQAPIDYGNINEIFVHNPNAFDIDGDSLVYQFITPLSGPTLTVPGYQFLDDIVPGPSNVVSLNIYTGEMIWNTPQLVGIYSIEYLIKEYRYGECIGTMLRHMQIVIQDNPNSPPVIAAFNDTCVIAGSMLSVNFTASDSDIPDQLITLSATGGPLSIASAPASYTTDSPQYNPSLSIVWNTNCNHIRKEPYQLVIKAEDHFINSEGIPIPLSDLATWQIKVLAPAPTGLSATVLSSNSVQLSWDSTYLCASADDFLGYSIFRKRGCGNNASICDNDPIALGYTLLASGLSTAMYIDNTIVPGQEYSYIFVAEFGETNPFGIINNYVLGALSQEVCINLPLNLAIITNVSVTNTDNMAGTMYVAWSKPKTPDFDTTLHTGPYTYQIWRNIGNTVMNPSLIQSYTTDNFYQANDTIYNDTGLNIQDNTYMYSIVWLSGTDSLGATSASSIYINTSPSDNQISLSWNENVPWNNERYIIFRKNGTVWDSIGGSFTKNYLDRPLQNGVPYCYYVKSIGHYSLGGFVDPIVNDSQEKCSTPQDNIVPCATVLQINNDCNKHDQLGNTELFINTLTWDDISNLSCGNDVLNYEVYYLPLGSSIYQLVHTTLSGDTTFQHILDSSLAGCYYIVALDSVNNPSPPSNKICIENCEEYLLPNTFTPNGDGQNDVFMPRINRFINSVNITIVNRWGVSIYTTNDPQINWNGKINNTGADCPQGTYYYTCEVYTNTTSGSDRIDRINGFIELLR